MNEHKPRPLSIRSLDLVNYRAFDTLHFEPGRLSVIAGINGSGKSSILCAIAISLSQLSSRIVGGRTPNLQIRSEEIRHDAQKSEIVLTLEDEGLTFQAASIKFSRERAEGVNRSLPQDVHDLSILANYYIQNLQDQPLASIPVLVYYPVSRAVVQAPLDVVEGAKFDQLKAYDGAFESQRNFETFFVWFRQREDLENEHIRDDRSYVDPQLQAVRLAIERIMVGYTGLRIKRNPLRMVVQKQEQELQIDQLSDGEKSLLALIGDLARRLCMANPGLSDPLAGNGVVLIDEVDLHLHPHWQRKVIECLPNVFPQIQFLVTSHSPIVAGRAPAGSLYVLEGTNIKLVEAYGQDAGRILDEIFDTPPRPSAIANKLSALSDALDEGNLSSAQLQLEELSQELRQDDPDLVRSRLRLHRLSPA